MPKPLRQVNQRAKMQIDAICVDGIAFAKAVIGLWRMVHPHKYFTK
jgi:hypothetical protein